MVGRVVEVGFPDADNQAVEQREAAERCVDQLAEKFLCLRVVRIAEGFLRTVLFHDGFGEENQVAHGVGGDPGGMVGGHFTIKIGGLRIHPPPAFAAGREDIRVGFRPVNRKGGGVKKREAPRIVAHFAQNARVIVAGFVTWLARVVMDHVHDDRGAWREVGIDHEACGMLWKSSYS